jgi:hypothetical protein
VSLELIRTIRCDHRGPDGEQCCTAWGSPIEQPTAALLRAHLRSSGWRRRKGRDLCPEHARPSALSPA